MEKALVTSQFKGRYKHCRKYGRNKQDCRSNGKKRSMRIQAKKVVLMELVITETSLDLSKQIAIRNRVMNKQI